MTVASHQKLHDVVRKRFSDEFGKEYSVSYDNAPFTQPDSETWIRWSVTTGDSFPIELSGKTQRHTGVAIAQVFSLLGKGTREALILADRIVAKFLSQADTTSVSGNSVVFRTPSIRQVGRTDSQWWQINVTCPFYADEIT